MDNNQLLANLIAQPGKVGPEHVSMLRDMALQFPYAQPIHLLLAKAEKALIPKAALYSKGNVLYHILNIVPVVDTVIEERNEDNTIAISAAKTDFVEDEVFEEIVELKDFPTIDNSSSNSEKDSQSADFHAIEDSYLENVATTDFFAFEQQVGTDLVPAAPHIETVTPDQPEVNRMSKYDDDELPYTFLWWLAKTRKEHEQIFQPYAQPMPNVSRQQQQQQVSDQQNRSPLQQQFVEHIFHIQTPFEVSDHLADFNRKDHKDGKGAGIIEKFLKEDPTIKPPKPEQIDTENKAKKSAEDHYDLVSETLAKIYIEQMLYHKAIDTYKKLSLKYPEKSRYFADLIQSIEKKF